MGNKKKRMQASEQEQAGQQRDERQRSGDWADGAADARTADDPRARAPHDRAGMPSTGAAR